MSGLRATGRERGFALLVVLWTLVLIAFLIARLTAASTTETRVAANLAANAAAEAAADGAIYQAVFQLSAAQAQDRWALDGAAHEIRIGRSLVTLRLYNEAGLVNPNSASPVIVEALLRVLGADPDSAANLTMSIAQWVGKSYGPGLQTVAAQYAIADPNYRPPRVPVESIGELSGVRGMTPEMLAALRPHLTLFAPGDPDPATSDPTVAAALALGAQLAPARLPAQGVPGIATIRMNAVAHGPGNAQVARTVVVRIDPSLANGYAILATLGSGD